MHDHAVRIDEHDREFRVRKLLIERGHLELRARDQVACGLAAVGEFLLGQDGRHHEALGIEPELVQAANPRLGNRVVRGAGRERVVDDIQDFSDMSIDVSERRHGGLSPWRLIRVRGVAGRVSAPSLL